MMRKMVGIAEMCYYQIFGGWFISRMKDLEEDALQAQFILENSKTRLKVEGSVPNGKSAPEIQVRRLDLECK